MKYRVHNWYCLSIICSIPCFLTLNSSTVEGNTTDGWNVGRPALYLLKHAYNNESTWESPWIQVKHISRSKAG